MNDNRSTDKNGVQKMKRSHMICFIMIELIYLGMLSGIGFSQTIPRVKIVGRVTDASDKNPIHFANVYFANTTMGAATDEEGLFTIVNVPLGTYELVVSMMGYEPLTREVRLKDKEVQELKIKLWPKVLEAPELQVEAAFPHIWRRHFQIFKRQFIGTSENASKCQITNPEVLDFHLTNMTQVLKATAGEPLQIENHGLGYRLHFLLNDFTYRNDFSISFQGQPRFETLTPKD